MAKTQDPKTKTLDANGVPIKKGPTFVWGGGKKSKPETVARSLRALAMILRVGETEARALEIVGEQFHKYTIGRAYTKAADAMREDGASFKQAILHEDVFPRTVRELISAAPTASAMQKNLMSASRLIANSQDVKKKLLISMIQPGVMLIMCIAFLFIATALIIPGFTGIFETLNAETPKAALIVMKAADITKWVIGILIIILILLTTFWITYGRRSYPVRVFLDNLIIKTPIVGNIIQLSTTSRLFELLSLNLTIGMAEPAALEAAANGCGNEAIKKHCLEHAEAMRTNGTKLQQFVKSPLFPISAQYMIAAAPSVTQEILIMTELSPEYRNEADLLIDGFAKTVEPIMTYIVYGVAGLLIIAIVVPMYAMYPALMDFGDEATGGNDVSIPQTTGDGSIVTPDDTETNPEETEDTDNTEVDTENPASVPSDVYADAVIPTDSVTCPDEHPIKGDTINMTYWNPDMNSYAGISTTACFINDEDASLAGFAPGE